MDNNQNPKKSIALTLLHLGFPAQKVEEIINLMEDEIEIMEAVLTASKERKKHAPFFKNN